MWLLCRSCVPQKSTWALLSDSSLIAFSLCLLTMLLPVGTLLALRLIASGTLSLIAASLGSIDPALYRLGGRMSYRVVSRGTVT